MPRATYTWEELCTVETIEAAADFVEVELCCSQVTHTDPVSVLSAMVSITLCQIKIWRCNESDRSRIFHDTKEHIREDDVECEGPTRA
ncbi:hypothetical protein JG687_00014810 [Phytophthora cactorum]|uniref:Uncharacterized protein n=1 Tax=Phytophthora cactorum TaxID=29920 RepID=A0A8T1TW25_9STRA|nr:hypothetical protein JG687_00014810 [Phytophthora cactorum]